MTVLKKCNSVSLNPVIGKSGDGSVRACESLEPESHFSCPGASSARSVTSGAFFSGGDRWLTTGPSPAFFFSVSASVLRPLVITLAVFLGFVQTLEAIYVVAAVMMVVYGCVVLAGILLMPLARQERA